MTQPPGVCYIHTLAPAPHASAAPPPNCTRNAMNKDSCHGVQASGQNNGCQQLAFTNCYCSKTLSEEFASYKPSRWMRGAYSGTCHHCLRCDLHAAAGVLVVALLAAAVPWLAPSCAITAAHGRQQRTCYGIRPPPGMMVHRQLMSVNQAAVAVL